MTKIKNVHFTGIKGVGMASLAVLVKEAGLSVAGSDLGEEFITDELLRKHKITVFKGFDKEHIKDADLVIATGAHGGSGNIEVISAREEGIPVYSLGEAVGKLMAGELFVKRDFFGVSVAGAHGKTTTTGIVATIFKTAGLDPSYLIGTSSVTSLSSPGHFGKGKYFVVEADEYVTDPSSDNRKARFLWQHPQAIVLTNIDFDHPDVYVSLEDVTKAFEDFIGNMSEWGILVACGDDENVRGLLKRTKKKAITYGFSPQNDYCITRLKIEGEHMFMSVSAKGMELGDFFLKIAGRHNALNALGALCLCIELGLSLQDVSKGISEYKGAKRRMEYLGRLSTGADVYDDYAHHPKEITETVNALRSMYPKKHLILVFQPHTYSRTKKLFEQFISSLGLADTLCLMDVFASARETKDQAFKIEDISTRLRLERKDVQLLKTAQDVVEYLDKVQPNERDLVVLMGAGDVYKIKDSLSFE